MHYTSHLLVDIMLLMLLVAISTPAWRRVLTPIKMAVQRDTFPVYLPVTTNTGEPVLPPPAGNLLAEIISTWFTGTIPPTDFYDPTTGQWRDTNGLGQMYVFAADGTYTYAGFLRLQNGLCVSEVSVYKHGTVQASGTTLTFTPQIATTRTVIICGSTSETTTEGPFDPYQIGWQVGEDDSGRSQLRLIEGDHTTAYAKHGMALQLVGTWHRGEVVSTNFYDPVTQTFAPESGEGAWYRFGADGTYSFGEFGFGQDSQGCAVTGWVYQEGTLSVSGGTITTTPTVGMARVANACTPDQPQQQPYVEAAHTFVWLFRDWPAVPKLVLIPLDHFEEFVFTRE